MNPELLNIKEIDLIVRTVRTNNKNESNSSTAKIMPLWMKAYEDGFCAPDKLSYGIYHNYNSDHNGDYDVSVAVEPSSTNGTKLKIESGQYLKFTFTGEMPQTVIDGWQYVWKYFATNNTHKRNYGTDFEKYIPGSNAVEIYISID